MKKSLHISVLILAVLFFISACVTINIYFPAAAVEKAADRIVEEVWGDKDVTPAAPKKESGPQSLFDYGVRFILSAIGPKEAFAQEADINVTTPAIRALKESIRERADSVKPFLDSGNVGMTNDGLLVIRSKDGLNLRDQASVTRLINAENADRDALYAEIAKANNFPPDRISDIKDIFAKSWIKQAQSGWWIQGPGGQWNKAP